MHVSWACMQHMSNMSSVLSSASMPWVAQPFWMMMGEDQMQMGTLILLRTVAPLMHRLNPA